MISWRERYRDCWGPRIRLLQLERGLSTSSYLIVTGGVLRDLEKDYKLERGSPTTHEVSHAR